MNPLKLKANQLLNTTVIFLFVAPVVVILYVSYVFNPAQADNHILYGLLIIADSIGILAIMSLWLTILLDIIIPHHHQAIITQQDNHFMKSKPTVDIFITTAGEPIQTIRATATAAKAMKYPHTTFLLDDAQSPHVKQLAQELKVKYLTRTGRAHAKAGNVNNGLLHSDAQFFAILDADQIPQADFITSLLPYFTDPRLAMSQAPQNFTNLHNYIAAGTTYAQDIFYKYVCPAKNNSNSVFCVGTNVIFRRAAIDQIGGIAKLSHSEDIWTSFQLHELGWKTLFVNQILTQGQAPDTLLAYLRQQLRWAKGGLSMLFTRNPLTTEGLNLDQRLQYFFSNSFFLVGITMVAYAIFPLAYLLFDAKPIHTDGLRWLIHYVPYVSLYYLLTKLLLGKMNMAVISVSYGAFYSYILALLSVAFATEQEWVATGSEEGVVQKRRPDALMSWIWPHILIMSLTIGALFVGWYDPLNFWATLFYSGLAIWNLYILFKFVTAESQPSQIQIA